MTNKIPQEIEEKIIREVLEEVDKSMYAVPNNYLKEKFERVAKLSYKAGQKQNLDFTDGFREGRLYEREKVLKLIENLRLKYKGNSFISLIDEYSEELLIEIKEGEC